MRHQTWGGMRPGKGGAVVASPGSARDGTMPLLALRAVGKLFPLAEPSTVFTTALVFPCRHRA